MDGLTAQPHGPFRLTNVIAFDLSLDKFDYGLSVLFIGKGPFEFGPQKMRKAILAVQTSRPFMSAYSMPFISFMRWPAR